MTHGGHNPTPRIQGPAFLAEIRSLKKYRFLPTEPVSRNTNEQNETKLALNTPDSEEWFRGRPKNGVEEEEAVGRGGARRNGEEMRGRRGTIMKQTTQPLSQSPPCPQPHPSSIWAVLPTRMVVAALRRTKRSHLAVSKGQNHTPLHLALAMCLVRYAYKKRCVN